MSAEINTQVAIAASKANASIDSKITGQIFSASLDMAGTNMLGGQTQSIATGSWQAVAFGNISGAPGMFYVKNLDATNYVQFSLDNAGTKIFARLQKGQQNLISLESGTLYAEAHTGAVVIQYWATEA